MPIQPLPSTSANDGELGIDAVDWRFATPMQRFRVKKVNEKKKPKPMKKVNEKKQPQTISKSVKKKPACSVKGATKSAKVEKSQKVPT